MVQKEGSSVAEQRSWPVESPRPSSTTSATSSVGGLPSLSVERTLADLVELGTDLSLVADATRDAVRADKLVAPDRLVSYLSPTAARRRSDGRTLAGELFELGGRRSRWMGWIRPCHH